ncbi:MAG: C39 family peptidase [Erysipelotrichales bacterium]|nr:C39 family peptidase [Erysipelotrichales bacterium]
MKKLIGLILFLFLVGCSQTTKSIEEINQRIDEAQAVVTEIIGRQVTENLNFINEYNGVSITYDSDNELALSNTGQVFRQASNSVVILRVNFEFMETQREVFFPVTVLRLSNATLLANAIEALKLDFTMISGNINLPERIQNISINWQSSNASVLYIRNNNQGLFSVPRYQTEITLTAILRLGSYEERKDFVLQTNHDQEGIYRLNSTLLIDDFTNNGTFNNTELNEGVITLKANHLEGYYESMVFHTQPFSQLIGTWNANTNTGSTVELQVRVYVNGIWSRYFSYGEFALHRNNASVSGSDSIARMNIDTLEVLNGHTALAFQYRVILRNSPGNQSAELRGVMISLESVFVSFPVSGEIPPAALFHGVPKLGQRAVPVIGHRICSPVSVTMLLNYHGFDFSEFDEEFQQRYISNLVFDHGPNIFGNWVFNMAVAGEFVNRAFVSFVQTFEELQDILTRGPVSVSVRGNIGGIYTTTGHLLVVTGYEVRNGVMHVLINDPNIANDNAPGHYVEFAITLNNFMTVWRRIVYIIED